MARTYAEVLDEIKGRLDILEVVQRYVVLKKSGSNYMGCCPFHKEKTPSFSVNPARGIFKCFGCGEGGDAISFLMKISNRSFKEVIEDEAKTMGIELPTSYGSGDYQKKKISSADAIKEAVELYHNNLLKLPEAKFAREYLKKRGITDAIVEEYKLGYSTKNFEDLQKALNTDVSYLVSAGLVIKREKEKGYIDRFRNRLMIPVFDENSTPVAFGARALEEGQNPKYLNSPDTVLYNKSKILYGFNTAKDAIRENDSILICEGYFDVISLQSAGIKNVAASCGTSLTADHVRLIAKYSESRKIYLAFDNDAAGTKATERGAELIKEAFIGLGEIKQFDECYAPVSEKYSCEIRVVTPPEGKDPDEYIREYGAEGYTEHMKNAPLLLDYRLNGVLKHADEDITPVGKMKTVKKIIPLIEEIKNNVVQNEYIKMISTRLQVDEEALKKEIHRNVEDDGSIVHEKSQIVTKTSNLAEKAQKNLLSLFFTDTSEDNISRLTETIKDEKFETENLNLLKTAIDKTIIRIHNTKDLTKELFVEFAENGEVINIITDLTTLSENFKNLSAKDFKELVSENTAKIAQFRRKEELRLLRHQQKEVNNGEAELIRQIKLRDKLKEKSETGEKN